MDGVGHGFVGTHELPFTHLLPLHVSRFATHDLATLAAAMKGDPDTVKDGPDPEENLWVPAGYTYFSQFVDHDLTFDNTSSLNPADMPADGSRVPTDLRTARFDLDCVYGDGPGAQPFMYDEDGATLLLGGAGQVPGVTVAQAKIDLLRAPNGRAIIGDKRNDENSIVCQIQIGFIRYHNAIVAALKTEEPTSWNVPHDLYASARNEVLWTYQMLLVEDLLPRVIKAEVQADLKGKSKAARAGAYALYTEDKRANLPREFVAAAYRFGHSGVRTGYRLNTETRLSIFRGSVDPASDDSLLGFDPLPASHVIDDWGRFFPTTPPGADIDDTGRVAAGDAPNPAVRLQFAYKLDPTIVDPLGVLPPSVAGSDATSQAIAVLAPKDKLPDPSGRPSLALLNLLRGNVYGIATGQEVANALIAAGKPVEKLKPDEIVTRTPSKKAPQGVNPGDAQVFQWTAIPAALQHDTPLWFYALAEAQRTVVDGVPGDKDRLFVETLLLNGVGARTQLGWVGGRIVAEVFYALLDEDPDSFVNAAAAKGFKPRLAHGGPLCVRNLLDFH